MTNITELKIGKKIGICAHSYEGGALCFLTACREGAKRLGPHMHPNIILSAIPMGISMPSWESGNHDEISRHLFNGVDQIAKGGADFFICPDNTGHIVLEKIIDELPIPGLHIADVVCQEITANEWERIGLLGTKWTMTGSVYKNALNARNLIRMIPNETNRSKIDDVIFKELCQGIFKKETIELFLDSIEELKQHGAQCVILGCTEIPLIINSENSSLPILDTTRLLAKYAVKLALSEKKFPSEGWIKVQLNSTL
ncbi:MAG: amino acid racemase [Calditrichaeota bacterium]|nr:amino acid racemase [Calditrichota bacterium]